VSTTERAKRSTGSRTVSLLGVQQKGIGKCSPAADVVHALQLMKNAGTTPFATPHCLISTHTNTLGHSRELRQQAAQSANRLPSFQLAPPAGAGLCAR